MTRAPLRTQTEDAQTVFNLVAHIGGDQVTARGRGRHVLGFQL
jgi:hypothetical protein